MKRSLIIAAIIAAAAVFSSSAYAATASTTLYVSSTIVSSCSVSTAPVDFGAHNGLNPVFANGSVTVNCTTDTPYSIALDAGLHYNGAQGLRAISSGANDLAYSLYKNSYITPWGDSDFANTFPNGMGYGGTGSGADQVYTVFGLLYAAPGAPEGVYTDVVTVTVHY